ncbi:hypothetical protein SDC9_135872 [bioreactor metagenome]|uniref:Uncharacterized protein n=1 Tax=bioreactor metagenome TaxID=1076179 RepID=A0A645DID2_9ZZZZ
MSVEADLSVFPLEGGGQGAAVRPRLRLGEAQHKAHPAVYDLLHALGLLLGIAEAEHVGNGQRLPEHKMRASVFADFLGHQHEGDGIHRRSAVLLGHAQHAEARRGKGVHKALGIFSLLVALLHVLLRAVPSHHLPQALQQQLLFLRQSEIHSLRHSFLC